MTASVVHRTAADLAAGDLVALAAGTPPRATGGRSGRVSPRTTVGTTASPRKTTTRRGC